MLEGGTTCVAARDLGESQGWRGCRALHAVALVFTIGGSEVARADVLYDTTDMTKDNTWKAAFVGDAQAKKEALAVNKGAIEQKAKAEMARLRERSFAQDITLRKVFAYWILAVVIGWMIGVLLLLAGMRLSIFGISAGVQLSDSVAIALLGSTSINVIGLLLVVARYLFPRATNDNQGLDEPKG